MAEDFKFCCDWMLRVGVICPSIHEDINSLPDFTQLVEDGEIICHLVNIIEPGIIQGVYDTSTESDQFYIRANIDKFKSACIDFFSIPQSDVFSCDDVSHNPAKILKTLSLLSNTTFSERITHGFRLQHDTLQASARTSGTALLRGRSVIYSKNVDRQGNICYESLLTSPKTSSYSNLSSTKCAFDELLRVEKNYVDHLKKIFKGYIPAVSKIIPEDDLKLIFPNIEEIYLHHASLSDLLEAAKSYDEIIRLYLQYCKYFYLYGEVVGNLLRSKLLINNYRKMSPEIDSAFESCEKAFHGNKQDITDLLTFSMQHILRYHLLLGRTQKESTREQIRIERLGEACEKYSDLAGFVNLYSSGLNLKSNQTELEKEIFDIQLPNGDPFWTFGTIHKSGFLSVKNSRWSSKTRYIFLVTKILLVTRKMIQGYQYKNSFLVEKVSIRRQSSNSFTLSDNWSKLTFYDKSSHNIDEWVGIIQQTIGKNSICMNNKTFTLMTFPIPTFCSVCDNFLKGIVNQGYGSDDGEVVHEDCIRKSFDPAIERRHSVFVERKFVKMVTLQGYTGHPITPDGLKPLFFTGGQEITVQTTSNRSDWLKGWLNDQYGWFPADRIGEVIFVKKQRYPGGQHSPGQMIRPGEGSAGGEDAGREDAPISTAIAVKDFSSKFLSFKRGDEIQILLRGVKNGWWRGKLGDQVGDFPESFMLEL